MPTLVRHDQAPAGARIGGKAGGLAALGPTFPVPAWVAVTPEVFEACARPGQAPAEVRLAAPWRERIVAAARALDGAGPTFAVRSSALEEDGAAHSFAGQLDTFLQVPAEEIPDRVEAVWRSAFGARVAAYRRERGLPPGTAPAVLVQRMVAAEAAGVAFSADPVSGRRGVAVVSAVAGLGDALVSGAVDADTWHVGQDGRVLERRLAGRRPALTDAQVARVAALARAVARQLGRPQDIEWALERGRLWLLQARPITTLAGRPDPDGPRAIWDNANIAESYCGVTTPLTFSFARSVYEAVYRQFCRVLGVPARVLDENRDLFPRMLGLLEGRVYYNLGSWYRLLALLPGFRANRGFMEQMMGVSEGLPAEVVAALPRAGRLARLRDRLALAGAAVGLVRSGLGLRAQVRRFQHRLDTALAPPAPPLAERRPDELVAHYRELEERLLLRWDPPIVNDFLAMVFYGLLRTLARRWCGDAEGTLQNDLLTAEGGLVSAEPARRVRAMAALVARDPAAVALLCTGTLGEIERWMGEAAEFRARFEAYLERFGDRCLEELKLESLTLHDEPLTLLRAVGHYARRLAAAGPGAQASSDPRLRREAEAQVAAALRGAPLRRWAFGCVLRRARARVKDRENLRFQRTRLFGRVRRIFVELGRRLAAEGRLDDARDVFWLEVEEVLGFVEGRCTTTDLRGLAAVRRAEYARHRAGPAPADRLETRGAVHLGNDLRAAAPAGPPGGDAAETLRGTGCCPGVVRGPARVILDPRDAELRPGEILVAPRTDPGWIMLFPSAAGLLVEHGSLLSHSAIVARELGIPAVVAMAGLTAWVKTGEWLELDGRTGVARKLRAPAEVAA
jgi:pyruvate,water dikinase